MSDSLFDSKYSRQNNELFSLKEIDFDGEDEIEDWEDPFENGIADSINHPEEEDFADSDDDDWS